MTFALWDSRSRLSIADVAGVAEPAAGGWSTFPIYGAPAYDAAETPTAESTNRSSSRGLNGLPSTAVTPHR